MQNVFSFRRAAVIIVLALSAAFAGVFTLPVLDGDEARYAQASAQMLESGDFLHIRYLDKPRNVKPAGIYWMQAISVKVFGQLEARNIWAWRLPSVLGAMLAALALYWGGIVLVGERPAFWGALLLAPGLLFAVEAGIAKTDAMLVGMTTLAMAALAHIRHGGGKAQAALFWGAIGAGILIKGPTTPLIAVLALLVLWRWEGKAKWMRPLIYWPGPMLVALMVVPWLISIQMGTGGMFLHDAVGGDLWPKLWQAQNGHGGMIGQHTLGLLLLFFPASIFLPAGIVQFWNGKAFSARPHFDARFILAWLVPWWGIVELMPTKLVHYPLPVFPALALIAGLGLCRIAKHRSLVWLGAGLAMLAPFLITALLLVVVRAAALESQSIFILLGLSLAPAYGLALITAGLLIRGQAKASAVLAILTALSLHIAGRTVFLPALNAISPALQTAQVLREHALLPSKKTDVPAIAITGLAQSSMAFLTASSTRPVSPEAAARALAEGQTVLVELRQRPQFEHWMKVMALHAVTIGTIKGYDYTRGQQVSIDVLVRAKKGKVNAQKD
jgi:4-amino-4-deoxy-L-arabinose transferase-like glycosyltransferase